MTPLVKYPGESRLYDFDFTEQTEIAAGETISTAAVAQTLRSGGSGELTIGDPAISGSKVQVRISGGVEGSTYALTCSITTSGGNTLIGTGAIHIADQPNV